MVVLPEEGFHQGLKAHPSGHSLIFTGLEREAHPQLTSPSEFCTPRGLQTRISGSVQPLAGGAKGLLDNARMPETPCPSP